MLAQRKISSFFSSSTSSSSISNSEYSDFELVLVTQSHLFCLYFLFLEMKEKFHIMYKY